MEALLALIPTKDWFLGAFIAVLGVLCWHFYDKYEDAVNYRVTVQAESKAALATATKQLADQKVDYESKLQASEGQREQDRKDAAAQHASDLQRLLAYAAASRGNSPLQGTGGTAAGTSAGTDGSGGVGSLPPGLQVSLGLADALRHDDAELTECWRERDSLTGK